MSRQNRDHKANAPVETSTERETEKPEAQKPELVIDVGNLPAAVREVRDALAGSGFIFDRGMPVKVVRSAEGGPPKAIPLTPDQIVFEVHRLRHPVRLGRGGRLVPMMLPTRVARMYLAMPDEWNLPPLVGICTAPLLASDGSARAAEGYDRSTRLWCTNVPALRIPERPTRADAEATLRRLRQTFQTFPYADAARRLDPQLRIDVVNLDRPPGRDESAIPVPTVCAAVYRPAHRYAPALPFREASACFGIRRRRHAATRGAVLGLDSPEMTLGNVPEPLQVWA